MLTQYDLKAIAKIVDERLDARLKNYPTKDDLKSFATKEDLNRFATKEDLNSFATKDNLRKALRGVARKKDLRAMENRIIKRINLIVDSTDSRLLDLERRMNAAHMN
jgi:hypothetical protein